jgi:hypothetical protein
MFPNRRVQIYPCINFYLKRIAPGGRERNLKPSRKKQPKLLMIYLNSEKEKLMHLLPNLTKFFQTEKHTRLW